MIRNRDIINKVVKSISYLVIQKKFDKKQAEKNVKKGFPKVEKSFADVLWKMDFIASEEPISSIMKIKRSEYQVEEVISIFRKFLKKIPCSQTPTIENAIKILSKIKE